MNIRTALRPAWLACTLVALCATPRNHAAGYTFTRIAASPDDIVVPGGAPTINNLGQVAFDGIAGMESRIVRGEGGALTTIASPASPVMPALNSFTPGAYALDDFGHVAFSAYNASGSGVYRAGSFTTTAIDDDTDPNIYPSISDATLAFRMATATGGGIFHGNTSSLTLVIEAGTMHFYNSVGNPDINASGVLVFTAKEPPPMGGGFGTEHILTFSPGSGFTEVTNTTTGGWAPNGTALADNTVLSDSGAVAFEAMKTGGVTGVYLATPDGGGFIISAVAESDGPYDSFDFNAISGLSINASNQVAFRAHLDAGGTAGIFTGPDPVADKVIAVGDTLDGKTVESVTFGRFALNDDGEVAFFVTFTSASGGGAGVYRATPVQDFGPVTQTSYLLRSDAAPTDPDHALFSLLRPPMINGAGKISFKGAVFPRDPTDADPNPITAANDLAIWADKGSIPLALIAREGSDAPGTGGADFLNFSDPIQSDAGEVAFRATLKTGTGVPATTSANADAIFSDAPGPLTLVARKNGVIAGLPGAARWKTFSSMGVVEGGCFGLALLSNVPTSSDLVLWAWEPGDVEPGVRLREGDAINFGAVGTRTLKSIEMLNPRPQVVGQGRSFNGSGPVAWVRAGFIGGGTVLMKFTSGIDLFDTRTDALKVLPASGASPAAADSAPGVSGAVFNAMNSPATNAQGHIAFAGMFKMRTTPLPAITSAEDAAVWAGPADALALIAREGGSAPGVAGAIFTSFGDPVIDDNGRVAFIAKMKVGSGSVTSSNDQGIWATTGSGLALIAREGTAQTFLPVGAVLHSFTSMAINQRGGLFTAKLRAGVGGVTTARDEILVVWRGADGSGTLALRERQYIEVFPGHVRRLIKFDVLNPMPSPVNGVGRSFNSSGQVMSYCRFIDGTTGVIGIDL